MSNYENFDEQKQFACRVIADHARSTAFAIADGILPGNEGRNYVLRKIMRRAIYHGREHLGFDKLFFHKVCGFVVEQMKDAYPELAVQKDFIDKMVRLEEERFGNTMTVGLRELNKLFEEEFDNIFNPFDVSHKKFEEIFSNENDLDKALEAQTKVTEGWKENYGDFQKFDITPLIKLLYEKRFSPSLVRWVVSKRNYSHANRNDIIGWLGELISRDFYNPPTTFEGELGVPFLELLDSKENKEDEKFVSEFRNDFSISQDQPTQNQLNTEEKEKEFIKRLDIYFLNFSRLAKLYDTYGTPKDLIRVGLEERGIEISEEEFNEKFDNAIAVLQANSEIGKTKQAEKINPIYAALQRRSDVRTEFVGYDSTSVEDAKVVALVKDNEQVNELQTGEEGLIVLDKTPFYAESGGQVGDVGTISRQWSVASGQKEVADHRSPTTDHFSIKVFDTFAPVKEYVLHKSKVESGSVKIGDVVSANVDVEKRDATRRNHTATHLVHAALREVLGTHVKQGGSVVAPNYLRFDFTHYQPLSESEIKEVEDLVNYQILQNNKVNTDLMSIEDAMRTGAMALFGEKYGEKVRVLSVGNGEFSRELCGGTHVRATGDIGSFKITNDEAIASGVRRIRAITGFDSFERFREDEKLIADSLNVLKTQRDNLPNAIEKLQEELKKTRKEVDDLKMKIATGQIGGSASQDEAKDVAGVKVIAKTVEGLDKGGMRHLSDSLMAKIKSGVVIIAKTEEEKVSFIVRVSDDLTGKVSAGNIVREIAPIVSGRGGGKADMAEGGGTDASKLNEAIEASYGVIEKMLN